ncbi:hypothetical protein Tco_0228120 [Tanacetum coccineum]
MPAKYAHGLEIRTSDMVPLIDIRYYNTWLDAVELFRQDYVSARERFLRGSCLVSLRTTFLGFVSTSTVPSGAGGGYD